MYDIDWNGYPDTPCSCGFDDVSFPHKCSDYTKTESIPFVAVGNDELGMLVKKGDHLVKGKLSGILEYGTSAGKESSVLGFVTAEDGEHQQKMKRGNDMNNMFKIGDQVEKYTGDYKLKGEVRSVFKTKAGKIRIVVEHEPGFLHIYNENNIRHLKIDRNHAEPGQDVFHVI